MKNQSDKASKPQVRTRIRTLPDACRPSGEQTAPAPQVAPAKQSRPDYEVGYGKPPKAHQWRKGQSGGGHRRRGAVSLRAIVTELALERMEVTIRRRKRRIPVLEALLRLYREQALAGDKNAMAQFVKLALTMLDEGGPNGAPAANKAGARLTEAEHRSLMEHLAYLKAKEPGV